MIRTLNHRAHSLPSTSASRTGEELRVTQALEMNGYPRKLIEHHSQPQQPPPPSQNGSPPPSSTTYITIPYIRNTSEAIRRIIAPLGIRTSFQPSNTLRQLLVHPKDPTPKDYRAGVVYQIPCSSCPQSYIGQTDRTLGQRLKEHKRAVKDMNITSSALAEHVNNTGHSIDWKETRVLQTCRYTS